MKKMFLFLWMFLFPYSVFGLTLDCPEMASVGEEISCSICDVSFLGGKVNYSFHQLDYNRLVLNDGWQAFYYDAKGFSVKRIADNRCIGNLIMKVSNTALDVCTISLRQIEGSDDDYHYVMYDDVVRTIKVVSDISSLDNIVLSNGNIPISFKKDVYLYEVHTSLDKISIDAVLTDRQAKLEGDLGTHDLLVGANSFQLKVTSERGNSSVYSLVVIRDAVVKESKKNQDYGLKSFFVNDKEYRIEKGKYSYDIEVPSSLEEVVIKAVPYHDNAVISILKEDKLVYGDNIIKIQVKDGEKEFSYVLNIKRFKELDSNVRIKNLIVQDYFIDFSPFVYNYQVVIGNESKLVIDVELESDTSHFEILGNKNLKSGSVIDIKVTSEDGTEGKYSIFIKKEILESNSASIFEQLRIPVLVLLIVLIVVAFVFRLVRKKITSP